MPPRVEATGVGATDAWSTIDLPGTAEELLESLGIDAATPHALVLPAVIRSIHHAPPGRAAAADAAAKAVSDYLRQATRSEAVVRVPLPLTPEDWERGLVADPGDGRPLGIRILDDRAASWLYLAFSAMDPESARRLATLLPPASLRRHAAVLAGVASAIVLRETGLEVPGGAAATPLWESLVGERTVDADRFVERLLDRDEGLLAHFYHTVASLDAPRQKFALHLASTPDHARAERFHALYGAYLHGEPSWRPRERPLSRPSYDCAMLLALVEVTEDGRLAGPARVSWWSQVFEPAFRAGSQTPPEATPNELDAAMLAGLVLVRADPGARQTRLETLLFAQRAFRHLGPNNWSLVAPVLRQFDDRRALLLVMERLGLSDPGLYARAVTTAGRLDRIADTHDRTVALSQLQGVVALLDRLAVVGRLDGQVARDLLGEALSLEPGLNDRYEGRVADWIEGRLLPAIRRSLPADQADPQAEPVVLRALAPRPAAPGSHPVRWEGETYRLDLEAADLGRMRAIRTKLGGASLDDALTFARLARAFVFDPRSADRARDLAGQLAAAAAATGRVSLPSRPPIPASSIREAAAHATDLASRLTGRGDLRRTLIVARTLLSIADALLAETLVSLAYTAHMGDPNAFVLDSISPVSVHDFGFANPRGRTSRQQAAWRMPRPAAGEGREWRVTGSLLALDAALSGFTLRRLSPEPPSRPPRINANDRQTFIDSLARLRPHALLDATAVAIRSGLSAGHTRILQAAGDRTRVAALAAEAGTDTWRVNAVVWTAGEQPDEALGLFTLADQLRLGAPDLLADRLAGWGLSATAIDGSLGQRYPGPPHAWLLGGRASLGLAATRVPDLHLRTAAELAGHGLPAALAPWVLALALSDYLDEVQPIDGDDWLTMATFVRELPSSRFEDYIAALTARGPLVPVAGER